MLLSISRLLKIASNKSFIDIGAEELSTYLSLGFREEIVDEINFKGLLKALLSGEEESYNENEALIIIDGAIYKFITGKALSLTKGEDAEEVAEDTENDFRALNVTDKLWNEGKGAATEDRLRGELKDMLLSRKLVPYPEIHETLNKILLKETGTLDTKAKAVFNKIKSNIARILYTDILNTLRSEKFNITTKIKKFSPIEDIEPQEGKRVEKLDPGFKDLDVPVEQISQWVEKWMGKKYQVIYENLISAKPLSEDNLVEKIEKEVGVRVDRRTINNWKAELIKEIKEKFFKDIPQRKRLENIGIGHIIKKMNQDDFDDFEKFVKDKIEGKVETRGQSQTAESIDKLVRYVKDLKSRGDDLNGIARDLEINISTVKAWNYRKLLPWYEEWLKDKKRNKEAVTSIMERLIMAMKNTIDYDEIAVGPTKLMIDYDNRGSWTTKGKVDYVIIPAATMTRKADYGNLILETLKQKRDYDQKAVVAYDTPVMDYDLLGSRKLAWKKNDPQSILEEMSDNDLSEKKENLEKFQKLFKRSFLDPVPRRYDILIEFKADYDWKDISKGKFDPQMDEEGTWIKDEPMFEWEFYNVLIDHKLNSKRYVYKFRQKTHAEGSNAGKPESSLDVTGPKGETLIHEAGTGGFFKKFIDEHFSKIRDLGMPPPKGANFRVEYQNTKLHREYNSTHEFEDEYGGIAFSDAAHADRAKQYAEFRKKVHEKHFGPGRTVTPDMSLGEAQAILKKNLKKNLPESVKKKIMEYQTVLNGISEMKESPLEKQKEIDKFIESIYNTENEKLENQTVLEHFREKNDSKSKNEDKERE